eukprot:TRINITY_DN79546_c0_g1_i2.p1 TRINITY_DN79546_c0_g1~~TRINITY_DN79546_c0_g1_i2.p1  ORF type:complete len:106 (-),score=13.12 TRINITY_DN79546_c0_g1_i2:11-328(-)
MSFSSINSTAGAAGISGPAAIVSAIVCIKWLISKGLETYASMPAARHCSSSPFIARAVRAIIGIRVPLPSSAFRIIPEASNPPISEIGRAVQQECRDRSRMPSSA